MNIPEALQKVGNNKRYQYVLLTVLCLSWVQVAYILLGPSYIFMNPSFNCPGFPDPLNEDEACPIIETCTITTDFTITAHMELYCGSKQFQRNFVQSSLYIGSITGLIIMNIVSDKKGRKFSFVASNILCVIGSATIIIGALAKSVAILILGQIFIGFGGYSFLTISYIVMSDLCSDKLRQMGILLVNAAYAAGEVSFFLFYNWLGRWQYFTIGFTFLPLAGWLVFNVFFMVQSPVFLWRTDRKRCLESLNTIAMWNQETPLAQSELADAPPVEENDEGSAFIMFTKWEYLKIVLLIATFEITMNMFYYGTQYDMDSVGSNFGVNMLIIGLLEFTAYFTSGFFIQKIARKRSMTLINSIVGVACLTFIFPFVRHSKTIQTIIVPFSRFLITYSIGILALFMNESFPDQVKSRGAGTIQALSNIGNFITPFAVSVTINLGLDPIFVVAVILLLGLGFLIPTKQTVRLVEDSQMQKSLISESDSIAAST